MTAPMSTLITLGQIVDARKVLDSVEAHARKGKRSMAAVRVLHGVLDEETLRLAEEWRPHRDAALALAAATL